MGLKPQHVTYFFLAVFLGVVGLIVLNFIGFYVHEFGSSSSAALWTMAKHESTLTITYTYDAFATVLKVPRSTIAGLPWHFALLGTFIVGLVYLLLAVLVVKWNRIKHNKRARTFVYIPFGLLFAKDIVFTLGCKAVYCNDILTAKVQLIADLLILIALVILFLDLIFLRTVDMNEMPKKKK
jgi:hypothetical protein